MEKRRFSLLGMMTAIAASVGLGSIFERRGRGESLADKPMRGRQTKKTAIGIVKDRRNRHRSGHGKYHRRSYLLGRPSTRHV